MTRNIYIGSEQGTKPRNIMVFNVAAESVGALSILQDVHRDAVQRADADVNWIFVLGRADLPESESIAVLRYPWVKKSWFHRLFFDWFVAPGLIKKYGIDTVLSLQNLSIPRVDRPQTIYVHQSLPFSTHRFSFFKDTLFWVYQNVIGQMMIGSIRKADSVIVQTHWMKEACLRKTGVDETKIHVIPPRMTMTPKNLFSPTKEAYTTFFYPAAAMRYKNHILILSACKLLLERGVKGFSVVFTLSGKENDYARRLFERAKSECLPIVFTRELPRDAVFDYYARSVLLFPSYIETFGLPLLESRVHGSVVLAADAPFSREILEGYSNASFFGAFDADALAALMERSIRGELPYTDAPEEREPKHTAGQSVLQRITEPIASSYTASQPSGAGNSDQ